MKVALYDDQNQILDVIEGLTDVVVSGTDVTWKGGGLYGIRVNFIIVEDSLAVGNIGTLINASVISQDKKASLKSKEEILKEQIDAQNSAIDFILGI